MTTEEFNKVIDKQIDLCKDILCVKAEEYATQDRLHNFKNAAGMMSADPKEALAGMMAKHTISVYDMCRSGKNYPIELWEEKVTDHINYLLLLKALVEEERMEELKREDSCCVAPPYDPMKYAAYTESHGTDTGLHTIAYNDRVKYDPLA